MKKSHVLLALYALLVFAFIYAPIVASFVFSFNSDRFPTLPLGSFSTEWYRAIWDDPAVWTGFRNSLVAAVIVAVLATWLGFSAAYTDYRYRFRGKSGYLALALLPPTVPVVILGLAMLAYLSRLELSGYLYSVIISHVVICAPFAMALIRLRLSQMDRSLEEAAWNMGCTEWKAMRHVILPYALPGLVAALLITMAVSFDEFAIAWFVSGLNETVPVKVLTFLQGQVSPRINAIGGIVFTFTITLVLLANSRLRAGEKRQTSVAP
jgi:spermidine/putrescine transport system permease protein